MSRAIFTGWLLLGLLIQPFVFHELPRVWFIQRWIEVLVLIGLIVFIKCPKKQVIDTKILAAVIGFFMTAVMASILGVDWPRSLWGNYYRGDGLITLAHFMALWLISLLLPPRPGKVLAAIGTGSLLVSGWVLINYFRLLILHQSVPNWQGVVGVSFNQPVFLAGYLAVALPAVSGRWRIFPILAIILTRAWGGYLGILLLAARKIPRLAGGLILLVMLAALIGRVGDYVKSGRWAKNAEARERIVMKGLLAWQKRPVFGWGWANFDQAFQSVNWPEKYNTDIYVDKAHSGLLEVLVTTGIVGLGFYLAMIILMLKRLSGYYLLMLVIWLVHSQTNVISVSEELLFWILLGVSHERA